MWHPKVVCPFCLERLDAKDWKAHKAEHLVDCRKLVEPVTAEERVIADLVAVTR